MKTRCLLTLAACLLLGADRSADSKEKVAATELEGSWCAVSFITRGEAWPDDLARFHTTTFAGSTCVSRYGGKTGHKCTFKIDAQANPKKLDVTIEEGKDKGKRILAIYELKENTLKICEAALGKERPSGFDSTFQNQQCLEILKRE